HRTYSGTLGAICPSQPSRTSASETCRGNVLEGKFGLGSVPAGLPEAIATTPSAGSAFTVSPGWKGSRSITASEARSLARIGMFAAQVSAEASKPGATDALTV